MFDDGRLGHAGGAGRVDEEQLVLEPDGILDLLVDVSARHGRDGRVQVFGSGNDARIPGQTGTECGERGRIFREQVLNDFLNT